MCLGVPHSLIRNIGDACDRVDRALVRAMPKAIVMTQEFSASAERVFAALDDHANMGRWLGTKIDLIKPAPDGGIGAVRRLHIGLSSIDEEIIERVVPSHIVYKIVRGLFPLSFHRGEINITALGPDSSRVVWQIEIDSKIPLLILVVRAGLKAAIQSGLKRLDKQLAK